MFIIFKGFVFSVIWFPCFIVWKINTEPLRTETTVDLGVLNGYYVRY